MVPASALEGGEIEIESTRVDSTQSRLAALARELVEAVGVDGAIRYCSSLGWRGVRDEVEMLRREGRPGTSR